VNHLSTLEHGSLSSTLSSLIRKLYVSLVPILLTEFALEMYVHCVAPCRIVLPQGSLRSLGDLT
jgi:hypothetical protein